MLVMPYSHQIAVVTGGDRWNERFTGRKTECEPKLNDPTTPTTDSLGEN